MEITFTCTTREEQLALAKQMAHGSHDIPFTMSSDYMIDLLKEVIALQQGAAVAEQPVELSHADDELLEEYERAKEHAQESCKASHNSYGCGYDSGYREGLRFAIYRGEADGK